MKAGFNRFLTIATLDGSLNVNTVQLAVLAHMLHLLLQDMVVVDMVQARFLDLLALAGLVPVLLFANPDSHLTNLDSLVASLAIRIIAHVLLLTNLFNLS